MNEWLEIKVLKFSPRPECISLPECPLPEDFFQMSELEDYETGISIECSICFSFHVVVSENENLTKFWESDWDEGTTPFFEDRTVLACKLRNHLMWPINEEINGENTYNFQAQFQPKKICF